MRWYAQVAAFMASLSGDGATTWKDAWPAEERMRLEPELLRSGVSFELNLLQGRITCAFKRGVQTCTCRHCTSHHLTLHLDDPDIVHHHLTRKEESSEMGASVYGSHNAIRDVVCDIARHAGHGTMTTGLDTFIRTGDRAHTPDILIQNWTGKSHTLVDVVISHPCYGCPRSMQSLDGDPIGSMRKTREAFYNEGALIQASVAKKAATFDEVGALRGLHMSYHALKTPGRMSTELVNFLPKGPERVTARSKEFGAGGRD